ncbi:MAG: hypothetical protein JW774_00780 [Candidatus Aureabacteria bacterium]|nr:hypothetical protein [Candidatus Auribacterota bacterium]
MKKSFWQILFILSFTMLPSSAKDEKPGPPALTKAFINRITIPEEEGVIKKRFFPDGKNAPVLLIILRDIPCHYEAQNQIAKILKRLVTTYDMDLVLVEGSAGTIDTTPFAAFKDEKVKQEFTDYFIKQGKITGPESLAINSDLQFHIYGIENEDIYAEFYSQFMSWIDVQDSVKIQAFKLIQCLNQMNRSLSSPLKKEADTLIRHLGLLLKLFTLKVTEAEYHTVLDQIKDDDFKKAQRFILTHGPALHVHLNLQVNHSLLDQYLPKVIAYYQTAVKRKCLNLDYVLTAFQNLKKDRAVFTVSNVYDDAALQVAKEAEKRNMAVIYIEPYLVNPNAPTPYIKVMKEQASSVKGYRPS